MTTTEQTQPGQEVRSNQIEVNAEAAIENLTSLSNILEDITQKLNHQVLGNCETLLHMEAKSASADKIVQGNSGNQTLKAFQSEQINSLIKGPIRLAIGRLKGLQKVLGNLQIQVSSKK